MQMKKIAKKIIEFGRFLCMVEGEFLELHNEFAPLRKQFLKNGYRKTIKGLIPFVEDRELSSSGLLLTKKEARKIAHQEFLNAKKEGFINCFNELSLTQEHVFKDKNEAKN